MLIVRKQLIRKKHLKFLDQSYQTGFHLTKKFFEQLANNTPNSEMMERSLPDIKNELNEEYLKLLKAIDNKKLTQAQKKEIAMEFTRLLEDFVDAFNDKKKHKFISED